MSTNSNSNKRKWEVVIATRSDLDALRESERLKRRRIEQAQKSKVSLRKYFENKPRSKLLKDENDQFEFQFMSSVIGRAELVKALSVPNSIIHEIAEYGTGYAQKCANEECDDVVVRLRGDIILWSADNWHCNTFYCEPCVMKLECPSGCGEGLWNCCNEECTDPRGTYYGFHRCDVCQVTMCDECRNWCEDCDTANHQECEYPNSDEEVEYPNSDGEHRWCMECKDNVDELYREVYL